MLISWQARALEMMCRFHGAGGVGGRSAGHEARDMPGGPSVVTEGYIRSGPPAADPRHEKL